MKPKWICALSAETKGNDLVPVDQGNPQTSYVARATHQGVPLATWAMPGQKEVLLAWQGQVHKKTTYEFLDNDNYKWLAIEPRSVPSNSVICGISEKGHYLLIGRVTHNNNKYVGTIDAHAGTLYLPYEGKELQLRTYEVLVGKDIKDWQKATFETIPENAVVGGQDSDGAVIYVGRALHNGEHLPAKVIPSKRCCYIHSRGDDKYMAEFEVLTGFDYEWIQPFDKFIPAKAVSTGFSRYGEPLYVGRGKYRGSLTPGLVRISKANLYVVFPYGGSAVETLVYEILVKK